MSQDDLEKFLRKKKSDILNQKNQIMHLGQPIEGCEFKVVFYEGQLDIINDLLWSLYDNPYKTK